MASRYKTYLTQFDGYDKDGRVLGVWLTIDTETEDPPVEYIKYFDVSNSEAEEVKQGVDLDNYVPTEGLR